MPQYRVSKSRVDQYRNLGEAVIELGVPAMAPCPQCQKSNTVCMVQKGYKRCGPCIKKNMVCGGHFSKAEFDRLSRKKAELREKSASGQKLMLQLAQELVKAQKEVADAEKRISILSGRQMDMADREARALGELDDSGSDDAQPEPLVAVMDDDPFAWDDPAFEAVLFSDPAQPLYPVDGTGG